MSDFPHDHERPRHVFEALLATVPEDERASWSTRWDAARRAEDAMREYNRRWDDSLLGVARYGQ